MPPRRPAQTRDIYLARMGAISLVWRRDPFIKVGFVARLVVRVSFVHVNVLLIHFSDCYHVQIITSAINIIEWAKFIRHPTIFLSIVPAMPKPRAGKGEKVTKILTANNEHFERIAGLEVLSQIYPHHLIVFLLA